MFELRLQDAQAARGGNVDGLSRGRFTTYDEALQALDAEHERLTAQLAANGEGGTALQLQMVVVEVHQDAETGLVWSCFQSQDAHTRDATAGGKGRRRGHCLAAPPTPPWPQPRRP